MVLFDVMRHAPAMLYIKVRTSVSCRCVLSRTPNELYIFYFLRMNLSGKEMYPFAFSISFLALGIGVVKSAEILGFAIAIWGAVLLLLDMRSLVKLSPKKKAILVTGCDTGE